MRKKTNLKSKSRDWMKKSGWMVANVEHFNHHIKRTQDLFGVFDLLAVCGCGLSTHGIHGIQVTDNTNSSKHIEKMLASEELRIWLKAKGKAGLHVWRREGRRWKLEVRLFYLSRGVVKVALDNPLASRVLPERLKSAKPHNAANNSSVRGRAK